MRLRSLVVRYPDLMASDFEVLARLIAFRRRHGLDALHRLVARANGMTVEDLRRTVR